MEYTLKMPLNGNIVMTSCFHENKSWLSDPALYKFIWVREGTLSFLFTTPEVWVPD